MKHNHCRIVRKIKININLKRTKAISKAFKRKGELDKSFIHKSIVEQRHNDSYHYYYCSYGICGSHESNPQAMFTSRNSHKKTNHK